jgi:hypothetical protein
MTLNSTAERPLYAVVQRRDRMWKVNRAGMLVSMHQNKTDAIDFAMKHSQAKAVIVVVPEPTEDDAMSSHKRAKRKAQVDAEVARKQSEHEKALKLPTEPDAPVEKNVVKSSADEARPRPQ